MIQIRRLFALLLLVLAMGLAANAQTYRSGNTFISSTGERKAEPTKTKFTWRDSKGSEYPIYISSKGSCFVIKGKDKNGKDKKTYLGPEISQQICKELGVKYKGNSHGRT